MKPPLLYFGPGAEAESGAARMQAGSGRGLHIAGRFRLKNRRELAQLLDLRSEASDDTIILEGWRRWGYDLATQLRGAFAIVIFDAEAEAIYAARDVFGQEPLFLAPLTNGWAFGDNPRTLRSALDRAPLLDHLQIADFLADHVVDRHRTFFVGIERLPAAHWTAITPAGRTTRRYWSVSDAPIKASQSDDAVCFRDRLDAAVAFHAEDIPRIGVFVSGGMDSSSVLASLMAQPQSDCQVLGLTRTYQDLPSWSDGPYIALVKDAFAFDHCEIPSTVTNPLDGAEEVILANDGPVQAYGFAANLPLYQHARDKGISVVLDGHGGDEVVSLGLGLLNELAMQGQWLKLWYATKAPAQMYGSGRFRWLTRYLMHIKVARAARNLWRRSEGGAVFSAQPSILAPALERLAGDSRYKAVDPHRRPDHTERDIHEFVLGSPIQQYAQELLVLVGRAHGIECRMPFLDRDLAEFSLALPAQTKLKNGLTRAILREAMRDRLPRELLKRPDKFDFSRAFITGLMHDSERLLAFTNPEQYNLEPFVNLLRLEEMRHQVATAPELIDIMSARTLFRVAQLSIWLKSI